MRKDMAQLLVERPRLYGSGETYRSNRRRLNRDPENAPSKQGYRKPYGYDQKQFNEYFAPIYGFLRKNCGRPWNKVWSELSGSLSGGGTVIDHVKTHVLRDFVILKPVWHEGVPCYPPHTYQGNPGFGKDPVPISARHNRGFYVDRHGLLQRAPTRHKRKRKRDPNRTIARIQIDDKTAYYKMAGVWYRIWFKVLGTPNADCVPVYDVLLKKWLKCGSRVPFFRSEVVWEWYVDGATHARELFDIHGSHHIIAYRKEPLSSRTIRREKLNEQLR